MKHNFVNESVKRRALDEYLEGNSTIKQISDKYEISEGTLYLYKKKNAEYVKDYQMKLADKKSEIANNNPTTKIKSTAETDEFINFMLADEKEKKKKETDSFIDYVLANNDPKLITHPPKKIRRKLININTNDDMKQEPKQELIKEKPKEKEPKEKEQNKPERIIKPRVKTPKPNRDVNKKLKIVSYEEEIAKLINEAYTPK